MPKVSPKPNTVDFETFMIEGRPSYPPIPVGVSIKKWGKVPRYYAWGHPTKNNCTKAQAIKALKEVWHDKAGLLFQNGKFDIDVAEVHLGLKLPEWHRVHDTMFLLFLDDPHQRNVGLKPSAKRLLGMEPEERDAVEDWLLKHQPVAGIKISKSKTGKHKPGAYIAYAPGDIVGPYANGDVVRTEALFRHLYADICRRGMQGAYDRERRLVPVLLDMERRGIRVDAKRLAQDIATYEAWDKKLEAWLFKRLKITDPEVNLNSGAQLIEALDAAGAVDREALGFTEKGRIRSDKDALRRAVYDKTLAAVLIYRTQLATCLGTFMRPWLATAKRSGGLIFTNWNQIKAEDTGARTGRLSSTPNLQNMPKEFEAIFWSNADEKTRKLPKCPWKDLPALPLCRGYIIPLFPDHVLCGRDYSQQEPRILAHFEDGALMRQYQENPWIDYHDNAKENLERMAGRTFPRKAVKTVNLGIIYGQGAPSLAERIDMSLAETKELRNGIYGLYPGLREMYATMKQLAKDEQPLVTWGGREYYCEPPMIYKGRYISFDYKMVNVLIQGSASECTKEGMIRYFEKKPANHFLLLSVHDEIVVSMPAADLVWGMEILRECMESVEFDVQILSEGSFSAKNWASMIDYDKKGKLVAANQNLLPKQKPRRKAA